jgi:hypothetical protein
MEQDYRHNLTRLCYSDTYPALIKHFDDEIANALDNITKGYKHGFKDDDFKNYTLLKPVILKEFRDQLVSKQLNEGG